MVFINHTELPSIKSTNLVNTSLFFFFGGGGGEGWGAREEVKAKIRPDKFFILLAQSALLTNIKLN